MSAGSAFRRLVARVLGLAIIGAGGFSVWYALNDLDQRPRTDAAEIEAPVMPVSASVPGRIVAFRVQNNASVKKDDVLLEIDPEPYKLRVAQAKASLAAAESELAQGERNMTAQKANAAVADEQIRRARENLTLAEQTLARLTPLLPRGFVSAQQVDQARTTRNDARISLAQAEAQARGANEVIGTLETRRAQVDLARATLALAERDLANTQVRAPFDGKVTGLASAPGAYVIMGQTLFSLIDTSHWGAMANFRETDLARIRPGTEAEVFVMIDRGRAIRGTVASIGWGVRSDEAANLLGLPVVSRSLNWVRVARRYPVLVHLHDPPEELMRIGASAIVIIKQGQGQGHGQPAGH